ncbi:MAG: HDOD domain-containing protein, partial [Nitrospinota bacterium]
GTAGKLIAEKIVHDKQKHEDYFIAGLIHDIGKIFLIQNFPDEYLTILDTIEEKSSLLKMEAEAFSIHHADVGALIVEKWSLADDLKASVKYHHGVEEYDGDSAMPFVIYHANYHASISGFAGIEGEPPTFERGDERVLAKLGIEKENLSQVLEALPDKVEEAKVFIGSQ